MYLRQSVIRSIRDFHQSDRQTRAPKRVRKFAKVSRQTTRNFYRYFTMHNCIFSKQLCRVRLFNTFYHYFNCEFCAKKLVEKRPRGPILHKGASLFKNGSAYVKRRFDPFVFRIKRAGGPLLRPSSAVFQPWGYGGLSRVNETTYWVIKSCKMLQKKKRMRQIWNAPARQFAFIT